MFTTSKHTRNPLPSKGTLSAAIIAAGLLAVFTLLLPQGVFGREYQLDDFIILVDDQLVIKGGADINRGQGGHAVSGKERRSDIGSRRKAILGGSLSTRIPVEAPVLSPDPRIQPDSVKGVAVIAPNVELGNWARTSHIIYDQATGSFTPSGSGILGPSLLENNMGNNSLNNNGEKDLPEFPIFPTMPALPVFDAAPDVIVPANATITIAPGLYRDLIVATWGKVRFFPPAGTEPPHRYFFRRIIVNSPSSYQLIMDNDVHIHVKQFVRLAEYGDVNPTFATDVRMYVEGADASYDNTNKNALGVLRGTTRDPAAFEYDGDGVFSLCLVYVKSGTMNIRGHSSPPFSTQWFGNSLQEISTIRIALQHPGSQYDFSSLCFDVASITCSCLNDFKYSTSSGKLTVSGINFTPKTVRLLAAYSVGTAGTIGDPVTSAAATLPLSAAPDGITIIDPFTLSTNGSIKPMLSPGDYYLGIVYPVNPSTGNTGGYCIFTDKILKIDP